MPEPKKLKNFRLSKKAIKRLEEAAARLGVSKTVAVEMLCIHGAPKLERLIAQGIRR